MLTGIRDFLANEDGPTSVEYGVVAVLVLVAVITVVQLLGGATTGSLNDTSDTINEVIQESRSN